MSADGFRDGLLPHCAAVVRQMQIGLYVFRVEPAGAVPELRIVAGNPAAERLTGVPLANLVGRTVNECFPGLAARGVPAIVAAVLRTGSPQSISDFEYGDARVPHRTWTFRVFPLPDECLGVVFDALTDQKRAEVALQQTELRLRALWDNTHDAIVLIHLDGTLFAANDRACELLGYERSELIGMHYSTMVSQDHLPGSEGVHADLLAGRAIPLYERILLRKDGKPVWVEISAALVREAGGRPLHIQSLLRDISAHKRSEKALRDSEERYRSLVDSAPEAIVVVDAERQRFVDMNEKGMRLYGMTREELLRVGPIDISPEFQRDGRASRDSALEKIERALRGESPVFEWVHVRPDGTEFLCEVALVRLGAPDSRLVRATITDITERRREEEALRQTQKLESLGVLAGGIAHDFNNLLMGILGNASLAELNLPAQSPIQPFVREIEQAARRASELTQQMLAYAGRAKADAVTFELNDVIEDIGQLLDTVICKKTRLLYELAETSPKVEGDLVQIRQVVMNLITNASEALEGQSGTVTVRTRSHTVEGEAAETFVTGELEPGCYACLEVGDTGCGMDEPTKSRIFDPFFTTKFTGRGLGLAAVLGIVRGHRGAMRVETVPGHGSTFTVLLPSSPAATECREREESVPAGWRGEGTILLIDDEPAVRAVMAAMLEHLGFDVVCAENGLAGVQRFAEDQDRIRAVLLDLTMPEMSGAEAFEVVHRLRPDTPVMLLSGYAEEDMAAQFDGRGIAGFLHKPFNAATLAARMRALLAGSRSAVA